MMTISRAALISLGIAVASIMLPTSSWAASFCDTEILSVAAAEVGDDLEFDLRVWNDDCGVGDPATWGSTEVELIRIDLTPETVTSDCLNHEPDHDGFYDSTETYNLGSVFGQGGVYQLVVRPYSSDSCSGDRGRRDRETFNISDPDGSGSSFLVSTFFGDGNPASFDVSIECNTGLPLTQTATISGTDPVKFIVEDFVSGTMTCTIVADGVPGYSQSLLDGQDSDSASCLFGEVEDGTAWLCVVAHNLQQVEVEVSKEWLIPMNSPDIDQTAEATLTCQNVRPSEFLPPQEISWQLEFEGDEAESVFVLPSYLGNSVCSVDELAVTSSAVESNDSGCQELAVGLGAGKVSCTIINTVFFEGIPTLSRTGLLLLALLVAGMGWVGMRRL